jgi:hypothetical protein
MLIVSMCKLPLKITPSVAPFYFTRRTPIISSASIGGALGSRGSFNYPWREKCALFSFVFVWDLEREATTCIISCAYGTVLASIIMCSVTCVSVWGQGQQRWTFCSASNATSTEQRSEAVNLLRACSTHRQGLSPWALNSNLTKR